MSWPTGKSEVAPSERSDEESGAVVLRSLKSYCAAETGVEKSVGTVLGQCVGEASTKQSHFSAIGTLGKPVSMVRRVSAEKRVETLRIEGNQGSAAHPR